MYCQMLIGWDRSFVHWSVADSAGEVGTEDEEVEAIDSKEDR